MVHRKHASISLLSPSLILACAVALVLLVSALTVRDSAPAPAELEATRQDAADSADSLAREEPVQRVSIFDQWYAPAKGAQKDFDEENPSDEYVEKGYVTTGRRYDAHVNQIMATECNRKCQPQPGYNPSEDVVISCIKFCSGLYDSNDPAEALPQPQTRSWWARKTDSFVPGGRYVHYVANPFGGGAPTTQQWHGRIPDPYSNMPLGSGASTAWIKGGEGGIAGLPADGEEHGLGPEFYNNMAPPPTKASGDSSQLAQGMGPPLGMNQRRRLLSTTDSSGANGLDGVEYGTHESLKDIDDYFDTLPTKDCNKPTCSYVDVRKEKTKTLVKRGHKFTTKDIKKYERAVLGYHRRHESAMTSAEMQKIGKESDMMVKKSVDGYHNLEMHSNGQAAKVASDRAFRSARHSAAYRQATKAKGFVGYYENVFDDHKQAAKQVPGKPSSPDALEAARAVLARDTYAAKKHLAAEEERFKGLVRERLEEEEAAVAVAAHKIGELKAKNSELASENAALAADALQSMHQRQTTLERAAGHKWALKTSGSGAGRQMTKEHHSHHHSLLHNPPNQGKAEKDDGAPSPHAPPLASRVNAGSTPATGKTKLYGEAQSQRRAVPVDEAGAVSGALSVSERGKAGQGKAAQDKHKQLLAAHTHKKQSMQAHAGMQGGQRGGIVGVRASGNEAAHAASLAARAVRAVTGSTSAGKVKQPAKPPASFEAAKSTSKAGGKQRREGQGEGETRSSKAAAAAGRGAASGAVAVDPRGISRSERELEKQLADLEAFEHRPSPEKHLQHLQAFHRMSDLKRQEYVRQLERARARLVAAATHKP